MKKTKFLRQVVLLILFHVLGISVYAQKGQLTGNWSGARDSLQKGGLVIQPRVTLFQHNFVAGSADNESVFAGKADLMVKFNGSFRY